MVSLTLTELLSVLALLTGGGVLVWLFRLVETIATVRSDILSNRRDINIIMSFLFNRAKTELMQTGMATMNSPIELKVSCFEAVMPFLGKFIPFYVSVLKKYPDLEGDALDKKLFIEFESHFGDYIVEKICIPMHLNQGACLLAIIKACHQMSTNAAPLPPSPPPLPPEKKE